MSSTLAVPFLESERPVLEREEEPTEIQVRTELSRILSSRFFRRSERLRRFLMFIVNEQFAGRGRELNEYSIATEVYDRNGSFDPAIDSIVRVEARRLRLTLAKYYSSEGWGDPVWITIPKGAYEPRFRQRRPPARESDGVAVLAVLSVKDLAGPSERDEAGLQGRTATAILDFLRSGPH